MLLYAAKRGLKHGVEPLHPMLAGVRSVIATLAEANALLEAFATPSLGVVVGVNHVWRDPDLSMEIERASRRSVGFHVNDWLAPPALEASISPTRR